MVIAKLSQSVNQRNKDLQKEILHYKKIQIGLNEFKVFDCIPWKTKKSTWMLIMHFSCNRKDIQSAGKHEWKAKLANIKVHGKTLTANKTTECEYRYNSHKNVECPGRVLFKALSPAALFFDFDSKCAEESALKRSMVAAARDQGTELCIVTHVAGANKTVLLREDVSTNGSICYISEADRWTLRMGGNKVKQRLLGQVSSQRGPAVLNGRQKRLASRAKTAAKEIPDQTKAKVQSKLVESAATSLSDHSLDSLVKQIKKCHFRRDWAKLRDLIMTIRETVSKKKLYDDRTVLEKNGVWDILTKIARPSENGQPAKAERSSRRRAVRIMRLLGAIEHGSALEVACWLELNGLGDHALQFIEQQVDGEALLCSTMLGDDLVELLHFTKQASTKLLGERGRFRDYLGSLRNELKFVNSHGLFSSPTLTNLGDDFVSSCAGAKLKGATSVPLLCMSPFHGYEPQSWSTLRKNADRYSVACGRDGRGRLRRKTLAAMHGVFLQSWLRSYDYEAITASEETDKANGGTQSNNDAQTSDQIICDRDASSAGQRMNRLGRKQQQAGRVSVIKKRKTPDIRKGGVAKRKRMLSLS